MLKEISDTLLCDLPERNPWRVTEFLHKMEVFIFNSPVLKAQVNFSDCLVSIVHLPNCLFVSLTCSHF